MSQGQLFVIDKLETEPLIVEVSDNLHINYKAREWCKLPYPAHTKGCPNFGKNPYCPPTAPLIEDWLGDYRQAWFICLAFNLKEHREAMLAKHPKWTNRQANCLLYWQPKVNKALKLAVSHFAVNRLNGITYCPEAMGLNVIATAKSVGIPIKTKPIDTIYKIALVKE